MLKITSDDLRGGPDNSLVPLQLADYAANIELSQIFFSGFP